jgi:hypothetical protein
MILTPCQLYFKLRALFFAYGVDERYEFEIKPVLDAARQLVQNPIQLKGQRV